MIGQNFPKGDRLGINLIVTIVVGIVVLSITLLPIFLLEIITTNDLLNHLARASILLNYGENLKFQEYWLLNWHFLPNMAIDIFVIMLQKCTDVLNSGKIFISFSFILIFCGVSILSRIAHGRWSLFPMICAIILYNRVVLSGLINYLMSVGLYLNATAIWLILRRGNFKVACFILSILATIICAVHLFGVGLLGVTVVAIEIATAYMEAASRRQILFRVSVIVLAFVPAAMMLVLLTPHSEQSFSIYYAGILSRLTAYGAPVAYETVIESIGYLTIGACLLSSWAMGGMRLDKRLSLAVVFLFVVQLGMPYQLATATAVDHRIPIALAFLLICALDIRIVSKQGAIVFMSILVSFWLYRVHSIYRHWSRDAVVYSEVISALKTLPNGVKVATAFPSSAFESMTTPALAVYFLPAWIIVPRGGFTQTLYTRPTQHPLIMQPNMRVISERSSPYKIWELYTGTNRTPLDCHAEKERHNTLQEYDYVTFVNNRPFHVMSTNILLPIHDSEHVKIYRILQTSLCSTNDKLVR